MNKLEKLLKYVSENNDYYKELIIKNNIKNPLDINEYPILTRRELQENRYKLFSNGYLNQYNNQKLKHKSSSGSTGIPINIYWDYKDLYASDLSLWRSRLKYYNIKPNDKQVIFQYNSFGEKNLNNVLIEEKNVLKINTYYWDNKNIKSIKKILTSINVFQPKWIFIQPFWLIKLIALYEKYEVSIPNSLVYIETFGEVLLESVKRKAQLFFKIPVANMYGSEEMNAISLENKEHKMYLFNENVYLEIKDNDIIKKEGIGEVIVTNLNNYAMPLIRYQQGDVIDLLYTNEGYEIKNIYGRNFFEITINNIQINSFTLSEIISYVNNILDDIIIQYQFIYYIKTNLLVCNLVLDSHRKLWKKRVNDEIIDIFLNKYMISKECIEIIFQDSISVIKSKKYQIFKIEE